LENSANFSFYLQKNFLCHVNVNSFYPVPSHSQNIENACMAYEYLLKAHPIDLCCIGIGENGHIAFNEPSVADFNDPVWVKVVKLEEASRNQQIGEGYFKFMKDVPTHAITVTIPGMLASKKILCIVPEKRKAKAIYSTLNEQINSIYPATILQRADHTLLFLDKNSASEAKII
jgi:glucosamine-6-phosphate deaminase